MRASPTSASSVGRLLGRRGVAGVGQGEQLGRSRHQRLDRVVGDRRRGSPVPRPRPRSSWPSKSAWLPRTMATTAGTSPARSPRRTARALRTPASVDIAGHPRGIRGDRPHWRRQRAAIVGVRRDDALGPRRGLRGGDGAPRSWPRRRPTSRRARPRRGRSASRTPPAAPAGPRRCRRSRAPTPAAGARPRSTRRSAERGVRRPPRHDPRRASRSTPNARSVSSRANRRPRTRTTSERSAS